MVTCQEYIVNIFINHLTQCSYDKAIDYMEKEGREILRKTWPDSLIDILCDFALAEKNYSDANFEPVKNKVTERKEDKSYLDFVYRAFYQDLEKLQPTVASIYVSKLIASLLHFITVRRKILEFYNKLYEVGSTNNFIDFNELAIVVEKIDCKYSEPSPVDGILKIIQYKIDCFKHLFKCHEYLENWLLLDSVGRLRKGCVALSLWEKSYRVRETWLYGRVLKPIPMPPLMFWYHKFKHLIVSKFSLYFYDTFYEMDPVEVIDHFNEHKLLIYSKIQLLQKKSEAQYVLLVYDASHIPNYTGPKYVSPHRVVEGPFRKYPVMLCFPVLDKKLDKDEILKLELLIAKLISRKKEESVVSMNEIELTTFENDSAFLSMRVDLKIYFLMFYSCKPKNEDKDKANLYEFVVTQLRCHKLFTSINR